jgi:diguanylate cyclase (GGDEF)-like protein
MYAKFHPQFNGIRTIGIGFFLSSLAFTLMSCRNYIPDFISIVIPNVLLVLALTLIHVGLVKFYQVLTKRVLIRHGVFLIAVFISAMVFTYLYPSTNGRIVVISMAFAGQCFLIVRSLLYVHKYKEHPSSFIIALSYLIFGTFFAFRALITLSEEPLVDFMDAGFLHSLTVIMYQLLIISTTFSLAWIVSGQLQKELKDQATQDPLTKVFNRRALEEIVNLEHSRSMRNQAPLSVIMLDIDHFKELNDSYGHNAGDKVLVEVAELLTRSTRGHDSIARFGGEEFIVLLPETNINQARLIAEKLRMKISSQSFNFTRGSDLAITASFGVTVCELDKESWLSVVERADEALYKAKANGRNRVVVFNPYESGAMLDSTG